MDGDLEGCVQIGEVLAGKYRVDRVLGVGGMGVVVAATHLQLDQIVALKFVRREALSDRDIISRFDREARAAVRLKSEHVARILDVGRLATGAPYIVMEYLEGQDLSAVLEQRQTIAVPLACDFLIQACDAIAEAHALGIVHRDLKPANLFLATTSHGREIVKVLDFGISKSHGPTGDPQMTRTQAVMGSPGYMSPEQMRSTKNVDGRTDIWSLGVILYELVTGRVPFHAETFTALCLKIAMDPLPPFPPLPATAPAGFEAVVARALEKDQALRYASPSDFARALAPFASPPYRDRAYQLASLVAGGPAHGAHMMQTVALPWPTTLRGAAGQQAAPPSGPRRWRWLAAGGGALVVALGLGTTMLRGGRPGGHAPPPEPRVSVPTVTPGTVTSPPAPPPPVRPLPPAIIPQIDAGVPADAAPESSKPAAAHAHTPDVYNPYKSPD